MYECALILLEKTVTAYILDLDLLCVGKGHKNCRVTMRITIERILIISLILSPICRLLKIVWIYSLYIAICSCQLPCIFELLVWQISRFTLTCKGMARHKIGQRWATFIAPSATVGTGAHHTCRCPPCMPRTPAPLTHAQSSGHVCWTPYLSVQLLFTAELNWHGWCLLCCPELQTCAVGSAMAACFLACMP